MLEGAVEQVFGRDDSRQQDARPRQRPFGQLSGMLADSDAQKSGPAFDPDAALERYMAKRQAATPSEIPRVEIAVSRGFGRKGL